MSPMTVRSGYTQDQERSGGSMTSVMQPGISDTRRLQQGLPLVIVRVRNQRGRNTAVPERRAAIRSSSRPALRRATPVIVEDPIDAIAVTLATADATSESLHLAPTSPRSKHPSSPAPVFIQLSQPTLTSPAASLPNVTFECQLLPARRPLAVMSPWFGLLAGQHFT
jgi:hypothetical protein